MKYTIILPLLVLLAACNEQVTQPATPFTPTEHPEPVECNEAELGPNEHCK